MEGRELLDSLGPGLPEMSSLGLGEARTHLFLGSPVWCTWSCSRSDWRLLWVQSLLTSITSAPSLTANKVSGENGAAVWYALHVSGLGSLPGRPGMKLTQPLTAGLSLCPHSPCVRPRDPEQPPEVLGLFTFEQAV